MDFGGCIYQRKLLQFIFLYTVAAIPNICTADEVTASSSIISAGLYIV